MAIISVDFMTDDLGQDICIQCNRMYYILPNKRVNRITVLPRAIFKKLNCPRLNNCLSYDTFNFLKRGVIKLSSWTINKYEM